MASETIPLFPLEDSASIVGLLFDMSVSISRHAIIDSTITMSRSRPLRVRARALRTHEETMFKNWRFRPWVNGQRIREDGRGLGVPGGGAVSKFF